MHTRFDEVEVKEKGVESLDEQLAIYTLTPQQQADIVAIERALQKELDPLALEGVIFEEKEYTIASMASHLLPRMEAARKNELVSGVEADYGRIAANYLNGLEQQFAQDSAGKGAKKYWQDISSLMRNDFVQAYQNLAAKKNEIESSFWYKYVYGNKYTLATITALPGLVTIRMPYSTPIVMGALAGIGYKVIYPVIHKCVNEDLHHLAEFAAHQQKRINESTLENRDNALHFSLKNVLKDLLPLLETARLAGKEYSTFCNITETYIDELESDFQKVDLPQEGYYGQLKSVVMDEFLPRFGRYAAAQNRIENKGLLYRLISNKWVSAAATTAVLAPIYFMMTRMLPMGNVDDAFMAILFATGGYNLPKMLNPGHEKLQNIYNGICSRQEELDRKLLR